MARPRKYPWDKWLDGGTYVLVRGRDYRCLTRSMAVLVRSRIPRGSLLSVYVEGDTILIKGDDRA